MVGNRNLTSLEEAIVSAHDVAAGLAASALIQDLVNQDSVARAIAVDADRTIEARKKALADRHHISLLLSLIATQRAMMGVGA
jgi:hypothetical protein